MKLTFKTLQQQSFSLEAEPTQKVADVKKSIEALKGFPAGHQKLIHSGRILDDNATVEDLKISEKDFIVVMVTKPKAAPTTPAAAAAPSAAPATPAAAATPAVAAAPTPAPAPAAGAEPATPAGLSTSLVTGSAYESAVNNLVEMGFSRDQVARAMRAAFNNPDRAAEYLMTGIPDNVAREMAAPPTTPGSAAAAQSTPASGTQPSTTAAATGAAAATPNQPVNLFEAAAAHAAAQSAGNPRGSNLSPEQVAEAFTAIRNSPQFEQIRQLLRTDPRLLNPILQQLGQTDPQLLQLITQNQEMFLQLMTSEITDEGEEGEQGGMGSEAQVITVTPEEDAAIVRLASLGFERNLAIEAFLACDRNEELAANYLFDQLQGDDWQ